MRSFDRRLFLSKDKNATLGFFALFFRDIAVFFHAAKDLFLTIIGKFRMGTKRRISSGSLREASQEGSFSQGKIFGTFVEELAAGGLDAVSSAAIGSVVEI